MKIHSGLYIQTIQREWAPQEGRVKAWIWNDPKETQRTEVFKRQLGMHPAEFLLSEFLFQSRSAILKGESVFLDVWEENKQLYWPLIERFFYAKPIPVLDMLSVPAGQRRFLTYELNKNKQRVKRILGLK